MQPIRILVVDDSIVYRSQIKAALSENKLFEVVGVASNGKLALEKITQMKVDLLILDLEMPEMNGLQALQNLQITQFKGKVLVFASTSKRGAEITLEALKLGATDFVAKPSTENLERHMIADPGHRIRNLLESKILALFSDNANADSNTDEKNKINRPLNPATNQSTWEIFRPKIVVIGASTGGPTVLEEIFSHIGTSLSCPILIVQHMPPVFTTTFARRLQVASGLNVIEASHNTILDQNNVYVAPGDFHMTLVKSDGQIKIKLDQSPQVNSVRPAVDPLFETAAVLFKSECLGLVFTGMGADGKDGAQKIKENGGFVVIQEQESCVVFGMPGAVKNSGAYDFELSPEKITSVLLEKVAGPSLRFTSDYQEKNK